MAKGDALKEGQDNKGRFAKGNKMHVAGIKNGKRARCEKLVEALAAYEEKSGKSFVQHYIKQAFTDPQTARDMAGRMWPALKAIEADVEVRQKILNVLGMNPIEVEEHDDE